jgi:competence protein ComEC
MTDAMYMYFHDVGQGDCTFIEVGKEGDDKNHEMYLIDFGYKERTFNGDHPAEQTLLVLIDLISATSKGRGLDHPYLDYLFITHPDSDHWNMLAKLISSDKWETKGGFKNGTELTIGELIYGGPFANYKTDPSRTDNWLTIRTAAKKTTAPGDRDHDKQDQTNGTVTPRWTGLGGKLKIYLISSNYPKRDGGGAPNPKSLCLIFEFDDLKLMLLGDAEPTSTGIGEKWKKWYRYDNHAFLQCDVLKLAHHGSRAGTPDWWPVMIKPKYAFVSGDYYWSHPYHEALENVFAANTLNANFFDHWVTSYSDAAKDWKPFQTKEAMFANLWYVVTSPTPVTAKNQAGIPRSYGLGDFNGVTWLLQKFEGEPEVRITFSPDNVWPGVGQVPS